MIPKKVLLGACFAASVVTMPALAGVDVVIGIGIPPPVPMVEVLPVARRGYVWVPGYWAWHIDRHIWIGGRWVIERPGHYWVPERWVQAGPRWHLERGHWKRHERGRGPAYGHRKHRFRD